VNSYTDQIRGLAQHLEDGSDIPLVSVWITLREAAQKIDDLGEMLESYSNVTLEN
jgi:hypothetical protein